MKKYDIGILTLWDVPNYGTYAQAYALQKIVEKISNREVVQIAHLDDHHYNFYFDFKKYLRDFGVFSKQYVKSFLYKDTSDRKKLDCFKKAYDKIPHTERITKENVKDFSFRKVILGSDILWDYSLEPFHKDPLLFGNGFQGEINAYAASFGTIPLGDDYPEYVVNGIKHMKNISVREEKSANIVNQITGKKPQIVLDPTWLWDFTKDENVVEPQDQNYILVYGQDFTQKYIENLVSFAKENKKKIIALDCNDDHYSWCDKLVRQADLSPFEWIGYFKNADYVATSTFHGLTFSLIFQKKFAFCKTDFIMAKVETFLNELKLLSVFEDREDVKGMLTYNWDYEYINGVIEKKRRESLDFLNSIIGD